MENLNRVIRIFISSTFKGFEQERDDMARELYPALREYCRKRGFFFRAVDLRWGVSDEDGNNRRTMDICLDEIERCQRISPTLNFLVLHSGRYGSRFLPGQISREDWDRLYQAVEAPESEREELKAWYWENENAAGNPMVLRPRRAETEAEKKRERADEKRLMGILFPAADRIFPEIPNIAEIPNLSDIAEATRQLPYGASATELEIWKGLFLAGDARQNTLVFLRDFDKPEEPPEYGFGAEELRERLKQSAQLSGSAPLIPIDAEKRYLARAREFLLGVIEQRIQDVEKAERLISPAQREQRKVDAELSRASGEYLDFDNRKGRFSAYVQENRGKIVFVTGEQGTGKTALLKAWVHENRGNAIGVFADVQASGRSMEQIAESFLFQLREMGIEPGAAPETDDPITLLETALANARPKKGMEITAVLDSLEAVADINAQKRTLFSLRLPDWITFVVVSAQGDAPKGVSVKLMRLEPLADWKTVDDLLFQMLARDGIKLSEGNQKEFSRQFIPKGRCVTPLYLTQLTQYFAFRKFRSFDAPPEISPYPSDVEEMTEFLLKYLDEFIDDVQRRMFRRTLGYIALSSNGLSEEELLLLLERDERVREDVARNQHYVVLDFALTIYAHWARIFPMLGVFCVESESQSGSLFRFRNTLLKESVRRFVRRKEDMAYLLKNITGFFLKQDVFFPLDNPERKPAQYRQTATPNYRRVAELYPLLRQSGDPYATVGMFEDLLVIDAYIRAGEYARLRVELGEVLRLCPGNSKLLIIRDCLRRWDFLFRAYPEGGFLPSYVREYPEAASTLWAAGHAAYLEIHCPDEARNQIDGMYLPGASNSEAALSDEGVIAVMKSDKIRLYDWHTRSHTGIERIVENPESGAVFLYWTERRKLVVRFEHFRVTFLYTGRTLEELSRKPCPELKLISNGAKESLTELEFREADAAGYDEHTLIWYHEGGKACHTDVCYPLGTSVKAFRHGRTAAILVEGRFIDLTDLAEGVRLTRLEIPAAQVRFSPDGRRLLICQEDDTALCYDMPNEYPDAVPLPKYDMTRSKYAALYNLNILKRELTTFSAPFEPSQDGRLPVGAFAKGEREPLLACMSVKNGWLALYYHYRAVSIVRVYRLDREKGVGELLAESRVQPIYPQDMDSRPFRASEDEEAVILVSGGIRHIWDTRTWKWRSERETGTPDELWRALLEDKRRHSLTWRDMRHEKPVFIRTPAGVFARAVTFLYAPHLWRSLRFLNDPASGAGLITLESDNYLWILDRDSRLIHMASRKTGDWLCHSQLDMGFLAAAVSQDNLYILPVDSVQLMRLSPQESKL
ncbi:MAG: DUF4062 domain-containing protein [Oscillibacter sp.]|nr:DUF4062 domain-containing protein [Oscillibacter sp.]